MQKKRRASPYRNSKKMGSWEAEPIFRCLSDGKVERLIKQDNPKP